MLSVEDIRLSFGNLDILTGVSFSAAKGKVTALIGPNGAGKTSLFNVVAGNLQAQSGTVRLRNQVISGRLPYQIARQGLVRTFQIPRMFKEMPVIENLMAAPAQQLGESLWHVFMRPRAVQAQEQQLYEQALDVIKFLGLERVTYELAGGLSGGQQKLLELGRALMLKPEVILLDEPVAGVNPSLAMRIGEKIRQLTEQGLTFVLIEHNMEFVMKFADHVYVLASGQIIASGDPASVRKNPAVLQAYLGEGGTA